MTKGTRLTKELASKFNQLLRQIDLTLPDGNEVDVDRLVENIDALRKLGDAGEIIYRTCQRIEEELNLKDHTVCPYCETLERITTDWRCFNCNTELEVIDSLVDEWRKDEE